MTQRIEHEIMLVYGMLQAIVNLAKCSDECFEKSKLHVSI